MNKNKRGLIGTIKSIKFNQEGKIEFICGAGKARDFRREA